MADESWEIWYPQAGATGLPVLRTLVDGEAAGDRVLVHAPPPVLDVVVRAKDGTVLSQAEGLERDGEGPMVVLVRAGDRVRLEDRWPSDDDLGRVVLLPGGESGVLTAWWHAEDRSSWRWSVEFANSR